MANYMAEVAKMLGIEMNQDFKCKESCGTYRVTEYGLTCNGSYGADSLLMLLNGMLNIEREPWKPQMHDIFWYVDDMGEPVLGRYNTYPHVCDKNFYKIGNCYKTAQEAKANRDKWIAFYASDEVLEVQT